MRQAIFIFAILPVIAIVGWKLCFPRPLAPLPIPALTTQWHDQVYGLDDGEVIRLIAPPFAAQRATRLLVTGQLSGQTLHLVRANGLLDPVGWTSKTGTVRSALAHCIEMPNYNLRVQPDAENVVVDGDWTVLEQASDQRKMQALAQIIPLVTKSKIQITSNSIPTYCVVVRGSWNPPGKTGLASQPLRFDQSGAKEAAGVMRGPPADFFWFLEHHCGCRFADETADPPKTLSWPDDLPAGMLGALQCRTLFRTLESQTSLTFTETRQAIPIWNVRQRTAATQPR